MSAEYWQQRAQQAEEQVRIRDEQMGIERADIPLETYWSDRTAALAEALDYVSRQLTHGRHCRCTPCAVEDWTNPAFAACGMHGPTCARKYFPFTGNVAKDALLYLREHGWTLEREER